jgi:hypothetical protein
VARPRADGEGTRAALKIERIGGHELLDKLRQTRLRGHEGARPYERATLELSRRTPTDTLVPAQRYVLREGVRNVLEVRDSLLRHGVDIFDLDGGAWMTHDGARIPVIPPIVEESSEPDGRTVLLINDGIHRVYAARSLGLPITVVIAREVSYPYYALALPDGWHGVEELDELPPGYQKKEYRVPDNYKALFRDFNELFPGVQAERAKTNPAHLRP